MRTITILAVTAFCACAVHAAPPPPEAYGRLPAIGDASLSPDGKRVAILVNSEFKVSEPDSDLTTFRILNIDAGAIEHTLAPPPKHAMRGAAWADEQRPYYLLSTAANVKDMFSDAAPFWGKGSRIEFARLNVFSLEKRAPTPLMDNADFRRVSVVADLVAPIEGDPGYGRMISYAGGTAFAVASHLTVYRVNLDDGSSKPLVAGSSATADFMLDERGEIVARVDIFDNSNRWQLFTYENGKDRKILEDVSEMGMPLRLFGLLEDGRIAAVDPHEDGARDTMLAIDRKTGEKTVLDKSEGSDVGPVFDRWKHRVVGMGWTEDLPKQQFFDPQLQEIYTAIQPSFADGYAILTSWSRDRSRVLLFGEHANDAGGWYVYEPANKRLRTVGRVYPALTSPESLGDRQAIRFKARDGVSVPAYLTLPASVEPKKLPMVLLVHGGPHARDTFTFDWWSSFFASRGYAVLQVNYRGSTGYGYEWFNAGRGGWGDGVMQHDVEDGVAALVKTGVVDPARVCIVGGSYGGYAALAGATLTPDLYACAISVNGVTDLDRMRNDVERSHAGKRGMTAEWWRKSMGNDRAQLIRVSPIENVAKVKAPILIIHGADDMVVPVEQGRSMHARLKRANKDVTYVELKGDDHWLSDAPTRTLMLIESEKFLAQHLAKKN